MAVYEACRYRVKTAVCPRSQPLIAGQRHRDRIGRSERDRRLRRRICAEERYPADRISPPITAVTEKARRLSDLQIIDYADELLAFWDGHSRGTDFVIRQARLKKKNNGDSYGRDPQAAAHSGCGTALPPLFSVRRHRIRATPPFPTRGVCFFAAPRGLPAGKCAGFPALRPPCFPHLWADTQKAPIAAGKQQHRPKKDGAVWICCRNTAALRFRKGPRVKTLGLPKHRRFIVFERLRDPPLGGTTPYRKRGRNRPYAQGGIGGLRPFQHGREILLNAADHLYTRIQTAERDESVGIAEILVEEG